MRYDCEHKIFSKELNEKFFLKRTPLSGGIELTSRCNFRCIHCYETADWNEDYIATEQLIKLIDEMIEMGVISIFLTGGEAMLRKDFDYIYKYIREKGVLVAILSNGSSITEEKCKLFREYRPRMIDISMYGASEETYYKITRKKDSFKQFCRGVELLKKYEIPFQLKTVLMKENVHDLQRMRVFAEKLEVPFKFFTSIRPYNNGDRTPINHMLSDDEILKIESEDYFVQDYYKGKKKNDLSERQKECKQYLCRIAKNGFFVTYDGILNGCVRSRDGGYDLKKGSFKEGWKYLYEKFVIPTCTEKFPCAQCNIINYCDFCPGEFEIETGDPTKAPQDICRLAHKRYALFGKQ